MDIKEIVAGMPNSPGVYLMKDGSGEVIYIGKAAQLRKRVSSYFHAKEYRSSRTAALMARVEDVDFITTGSVAEALLLEHSLVKRCQPRYNVTLKDDKSYPLLKFTIHEDFPRLILARKRKPDGSIYYGPFTNAKLLREALKLLRMIFPIRSCRPFPKSPCLYYYIGQCPAPCVGKINRQDYRAIMKELTLFLDHGRNGLIKDLVGEMKGASEKKDFERAARIRDRIEALTRVVSQTHGMADLNPVRSKSRLVGTAPDLGRGTSNGVKGGTLELKELLGLPKPPQRIEAYDISTISGGWSVGARVTFDEGQPDKSGYRRFRIRGVKGIDDYRMMDEVIRRSFKGKASGKKGGLPDLIIIDGGKGHLASALAELKDLGWKRPPVISIAKEFEHIYLPGKSLSINLPPHSKALYLIQRIRDEAHRFAISYHRRLRKRTVRESILDEIRGVGEVRKQNLLKHFGSMTRIERATIEDLLEVKSIDRKTAEAIVDYFRSRDS